MVESARIEVHDSSEEEGIALYSECSFCRCQYEKGQLVQAPISLDSEIEVLSAFKDWMRAEGFTTLVSFCQAHFDTADPNEVVTKILRRQPVESNFDVMGYLFSGMIGQTDLGEPEEPAFTESMPDFDILYPTSELSVIACALTSVMMADGIIQPEEQDLLNRQLEQFGVAPLMREDFRVWRPSELLQPKDPSRLIQAMVELAFVDNELDSSEWQLIREYARYWRCDLDNLETLRSQRSVRQSTFSRLFSALRHLFFEESQ